LSYQHYFEDYDDYEAAFDPMTTDRQERRKRKPKARHAPKKTEAAIIDDLVDDVQGLEGGFVTTYQPAQYEEGWLLSSLRAFYDRALITDVLSVVKGGKEASVYRCAAHESLDVEYIAAKVYRPRMFRQLRNDHTYREGRAILSDSDHVRGYDYRMERAIKAGSSFGQQMSHESWILHEYQTLENLYKLGADIPRPYAASENSILMTYLGDEHLPAPTLNDVSLDADDAKRLLHRVLYNIELMLKHDRIHGDLSAYNILYWNSDICLIDFPQVINPAQNSQAKEILQRDVTRVCEYFARQGAEADPVKITKGLWASYVHDSAADRLMQYATDHIEPDLDDDDDDFDEDA